MADLGVTEGIAIASLVAGTGASVYAASQAGKGIPHPPKPVADPLKPDTGAASNQMQQADTMAKTAGGTLLSKPGAVGDAANTTRKSLLGQ